MDMSNGRERNLYFKNIVLFVWERHGELQNPSLNKWTPLENYGSKPTYPCDFKIQMDRVFRTAEGLMFQTK